MSDVLAAAAAALNAPETIVQRSAEAKAKATGASVDSILQAWAGGEAVATPTTAPAAEAPATAAAGEASAPAEAPPEPQAAATPTPVSSTGSEPEPALAAAPREAPTAPVSAAPSEPPVLVGRTENPFLVLAAAVGVLATVLLIGFVAPSLPTEGNGVYSSAVGLSEAGQEGRTVYLREGCAACHTQQIRPVVADAGLGGVTLSDSNQVLGAHRYGPDLAAIGSRVESDANLIRTLEGANHPSYAGLDADDLSNLVAYLLESK